MAEIVSVSVVEQGTRLIRWFLRKYPSLPQREFYRLCRGGQIRVNSSRCKGNEVLSTGDLIRIPPTIGGYVSDNVSRNESGEKFSLSDLEMLRKCIIHDDDDIVVFNKPAGLAVQGGTGIKKSIDKMATALFPYSHVALVHRLDRETSGVLVVAKTQRAAQILAKQFQSKIAHKEYLALLDGNLKTPHGIIDNYMVKGQVFDTPVRVNDGTGQRPQRAITEYTVLSHASGVGTWVLFSPKTGRTHQLRLHSAFSLNAPIFGDSLYGRMRIDNSLSNSVFVRDKLYLFAYRITLQHPTTKRMITFKAQIPDFMRPVMQLLELQLP